MKFRKFLVAFAYILSTTLAFKTPKNEAGYTRVLSYVKHVMEGFPIMRGGLCFEIFIPLVNHLADNAKVLSEICTNTAARKRSILLQSDRGELEAAIKVVQESLTNCTSNSDNLAYFHCLLGSVDEDKRLLDVIATMSTEALKKRSEKLLEIKKEEDICIEEVVLEAKIASDQAFFDLKKCMQSGQWPVSTESTTTIDSEHDRPSQRTDP